MDLAGLFDESEDFSVDFDDFSAEASSSSKALATLFTFSAAFLSLFKICASAVPASNIAAQIHNTFSFVVFMCNLFKIKLAFGLQRYTEFVV